MFTSLSSIYQPISPENGICIFKWLFGIRNRYIVWLTVVLWSTRDNFSKMSWQLVWKLLRANWWAIIEWNCWIGQTFTAHPFTVIYRVVIANTRVAFTLSYIFGTHPRQFDKYLQTSSWLTSPLQMSRCECSKQNDTGFNLCHGAVMSCRYKAKL